MKIKSVEYRMLRVTKAYENDVAACLIELDNGDVPSIAFASAQLVCEDALKMAKDRRDMGKYDACIRCKLALSPETLAAGRKCAYTSGAHVIERKS